MLRNLSSASDGGIQTAEVQAGRQDLSKKEHTCALHPATLTASEKSSLYDPFTQQTHAKVLALA